MKTSVQKKNYEQPAVIHRQSLESLAAACGEENNGKMSETANPPCSLINS